MRLPLDGRAVPRVEQRLEHGEVVLEIVDGPRGIARGRPGQAGVGLLGRVRGQRAVIRHAARDRAHDVERIERRHARAHVTHLRAKPRIRQVQPFGRRTDRQPQQQTFGHGAIGSP